MIDSTDILGRKNEIKDCIAAAQLEAALKRLIDFARDFSSISSTMEDEVILLSMEYYDLMKEERMEILAYEDAKMSKRKLASRMLNTLKHAPLPS